MIPKGDKPTIQELKEAPRMSMRDVKEERERAVFQVDKLLIEDQIKALQKKGLKSGKVFYMECTGFDVKLGIGTDFCMKSIDWRE